MPGSWGSNWNLKRRVRSDNSATTPRMARRHTCLAGYTPTARRELKCIASSAGQVPNSGTNKSWRSVAGMELVDQDARHRRPVHRNRIAIASCNGQPRAASASTSHPSPISPAAPTHPHAQQQFVLRTVSLTMAMSSELQTITRCSDTGGDQHHWPLFV